MFNLLLDMGDNEIGTAHIQLRRNFNHSPDLFCETKWYVSKQIEMPPLTVIELRVRCYTIAQGKKTSGTLIG